MANERDNQNERDSAAEAREGIDFQPLPGGDRRNPPETPGTETMGEGGVSESGGKAGGARGNAGASNGGAGGPTGESRGGPGEYKSTSGGDFDRDTD